MPDFPINSNGSEFLNFAAVDFDVAMDLFFLQPPPIGTLRNAPPLVQ